MIQRSAALLFFVAGCAPPSYVIVAGKRVDRPSVEYDNGATFHLEHDRAYPGVFDPRRPQDIDDGTLEGRICGVNVRFDASWYGARLQINGRGDVPWGNTFTRTEGAFHLDLSINELGPGHRRIRGTAPGEGARVSSEIDIDVSAERLIAHVGMREFDLTAQDEYLVGHYRRHGDVIVPIDAAYAIYGRQLLASMVPADQALLLVMMLTCNGPAIGLGDKPVRGFSMVPLPSSSSPEEKERPLRPEIRPSMR